MKTKIKNNEWKSYDNGAFALKVRCEGVHYTMKFAILESGEYNVQVWDEWSDLTLDESFTSIFGMFNRLCEYFHCTIVKFAETMEIVDNAMKGIFPEASAE